MNSDESFSFLSVNPGQENVDFIRYKNQELVSQIDRLKIKVRETDVKYFSAKVASDTLMNENFKIKEALIDKQTKIKDLTVENLGKESEIKRLREKSKTQTDMIDTLNAEVKTLKESAADLEDRLTEMKKMSKDERFTDFLREQKQELDKAKREIKKLCNKVQECENEKINLQSDIAKNTAKIDGLTIQVTNLVAEVERERNKHEISREEMQAENRQRDAEMKQNQHRTMNVLTDVKTKQDEILAAICQSQITPPVKETVPNANTEEVNLESRMPKIDAHFMNEKDQRKQPTSRYWKPTGKIPGGINTLSQPSVGTGRRRLAGNKDKMLPQKYKQHQQSQPQPKQRQYLQFSSQNWMNR